jgi:hypothetical protein
MADGNRRTEQRNGAGTAEVARRGGAVVEATARTAGEALRQGADSGAKATDQAGEAAASAMSQGAEAMEAATLSGQRMIAEAARSVVEAAHRTAETQADVARQSGQAGAETVRQAGTDAATEGRQATQALWDGFEDMWRFMPRPGAMPGVLPDLPQAFTGIMGDMIRTNLRISQELFQLANPVAVVEAQQRLVRGYLDAIMAMQATLLGAARRTGDDVLRRAGQPQ